MQMSTLAEYLCCLIDGKIEDQGKSGSHDVIGKRPEEVRKRC